ncbi:hypothetical protein Q7P37_008430 [Cladosporium fusiforme]
MRHDPFGVGYNAPSAGTVATTSTSTHCPIICKRVFEALRSTASATFSTTFPVGAIPPSATKAHVTAMPALHFTEESHTGVHHSAHRLLKLAIRTTSEINTFEHGDLTEPGLSPRSAADMRGRSSGLWAATSVDAAGILAAQQRRTIQIVCAAMASVSISAAACAIYWFWTMKRNYRRDLVLMLILGDFYKSLWYLIHGSVNFGRSQVKSEEAFCQVSGYMLQVGLQSCDVAILFISMHMALQIFPPSNNSFLGHDGLYKVRRWVFAGWILIPCFTAALAFINPSGGYQAQGAFCWLPIRPFWYRLALSWVPRYLIWLYIMWVAIRIYTHVGYEFRVFGQERDRSSSADLSAQSSVERGAIERAVQEHRAQVTSTSEKIDEDAVAPDDPAWSQPGTAQRSPHDSSKNLPVNPNRRASLPAWHSPFGGSASPGLSPEDGAPIPTARSSPTSRRGSRQIAPGVTAEDFMAPPGFDTQPRGSISSPKPGAGAPPHTSSTNPSIGNRALRQRRRAIQRQLRILFIYPVVYMLLWLIPFISHCMSYSDHFAQHPVFPISLLSSFCQAFMGFADVAVFCWRERPWRHVPGSDGTFFGSFVFWTKDRGPSDWARRESRAPSQLPGNEKSQTRLLSSISSLKRWSFSRKNSSPNSSSTVQNSFVRPSHKRTVSGGGGKTRESELAHERLKLERADYKRNLPSYSERNGSVTSQAQAPRKDWFDQNVSEENLEELGESGSQSRG